VAGSASQIASDAGIDAPILTGAKDLELVVGRGVVTAMAAVDDDTREAGADQRPHLGRKGRLARRRNPQAEPGQFPVAIERL
jgi:hypothetical protein